MSGAMADVIHAGRGLLVLVAILSRFGPTPNDRRQSGLEKRNNDNLFLVQVLVRFVQFLAKVCSARSIIASRRYSSRSN
jgi:hypothetical protein